MKITAVVLAGGLATRMGEICQKTPKSMLQFGNYPFLQYLVSWFVKMKFDEILILTGWISEEVELVFGNELWRSKGVRIIKGNAFWKTGEVIKFALKHSSNEDIFLCNGDTVVNMNFCKLYKNHIDSCADFTGVLSLRRGVQNEGAVLVENGIVVDFSEGKEPRSPFITKSIIRGSSTGCYFIKRSLLLEIFPSGMLSFEYDILPYLVSIRLLKAVSNGSKFFLDYGVPERYQILKRKSWILKKTYGEPIIGGNKNE